MLNNPRRPLMGPLSMISHPHNVPRVHRAEGSDAPETPPRRRRPTSIGSAVNEWVAPGTFKNSENPEHRKLDTINRMIGDLIGRRSMPPALPDNRPDVPSTEAVPFAEGGEVPSGGTTRRNVLKGLLGVGAATTTGLAKKGKGVVDSLLDVKEEVPMSAAAKPAKSLHSQVGEKIHEWFNNSLYNPHDAEVHPAVREWADGDVMNPEVLANAKKEIGEDLLKQSGVDDVQLSRLLDQRLDLHSAIEAGEPSSNFNKTQPLKPWQEHLKDAIQAFGPEELLQSSGTLGQLRHQHATDVMHMLRHPEEYAPEELAAFGLRGYKSLHPDEFIKTNHPDKLVLEHVKGTPAEPHAQEAFDTLYHGHTAGVPIED